VQTGSIGGAIWLLAIHAVVFFALVLLAYRREERHTFG
jgi:hypothetical protein